MLKIYDFSVDYVINPTLIKCKNLRFGWKLSSNNKNVLQKAYQIKIDGGNGTVFDSGVITSTEFFDVSFKNLQLESKSDYTINLTVKDNYGEKASYSQPVSTEILPYEWEADWIKPAIDISGWAPYLRTKFLLPSVKNAVMYASGLGYAEYYINGAKVEDYLIDPPQSNYEKIVYYRRFDVTNLLKTGGNAIAVLLGEGFYSQSRVWGYDGLKYGEVCLKLRLDITLDDGTVKTITTNTEDWKSKPSPITINNIYGGETYDCRLETNDFCDYNGSDSGWNQVVLDTVEKGILTPCLIPPVKVIRELPAREVHCASGKEDGAWIFDIGENIAGIAEFKLPQAPRGAVYVFRYAENLDSSGHLDHRSIGAFATQCIQQDMYICRGDKEGEIYRPRLTYHGFRYVEVTGFHDLSNGHGAFPELSLVTGVQISTAFKEISYFNSSNEDLNHLYSIMRNTYISNFHGIPEDCPAREKCGWLGDAHIVCDWGLLNYDSTACYEKYLEDIRTTYEICGNWMQISPGLRGRWIVTPLWGCAQILIPYFLYKYTGDREAVTQNFNLMELWVKHELDRSEDYIISEGLGDWVPPCENSDPRRMPVNHSSTAIFYEICIVMAEICDIFKLGDASYYKKLAEKIKESFNRHFFDTYTHSYGYWGTNAVALVTELYPDGERKDLLESLISLIKADDYFMSTAIYGNKYLIPLLIREGYGDIALKCLFDRKYDSFGTMLDDGATTLYEGVYMKSVLDSAKKQGSLNHPMQGGFLYTVTTELCGIKPLCAGFSKIEFSPCFVSGIEHIKGEYELVSGKVSVEINNAPDRKVCTLEIPAGVTCVINISGETLVDGTPYIKNTEIGSGKHEIIVK